MSQYNFYTRVELIIKGRINILLDELQVLVINLDFWASALMQT